ncbi:MAG: hypothetical protein GY803_19280 [Chloroflexi bacterium]|nr:hypothetical protein [Chloroflexota bacterium]
MSNFICERILSMMAQSFFVNSGKYILREIYFTLQIHVERFAKSFRRNLQNRATGMVSV